MVGPATHHLTCVVVRSIGRCAAFEPRAGPRSHERALSHAVHLSAPTRVFQAFIGCKARGQGGGLYVGGAGASQRVTMRGMVFERNSVIGEGGGALIAIPDPTNKGVKPFGTSTWLFQGQRRADAGKWAAKDVELLINATFRENRASKGAGLMIQQKHSVVGEHISITGTFERNVADPTLTTHDSGVMCPRGAGLWWVASKTKNIAQDVHLSINADFKDNVAGGGAEPCFSTAGGGAQLLLDQRVYNFTALLSGSFVGNRAVATTNCIGGGANIGFNTNTQKKQVAWTVTASFTNNSIICAKEALGAGLQARWNSLNGNRAYFDMDADFTVRSAAPLIRSPLLFPSNSTTQRYTGNQLCVSSQIALFFLCLNAACTCLWCVCVSVCLSVCLCVCVCVQGNRATATEGSAAGGAFQMTFTKGSKFAGLGQYSPGMKANVKGTFVNNSAVGLVSARGGGLSLRSFSGRFTQSFFKFWSDFTGNEAVSAGGTATGGGASVTIYSKMQYCGVHFPGRFIANKATGDGVVVGGGLAVDIMHTQETSPRLRLTLIPENSSGGPARKQRLSFSRNEAISKGGFAGGGGLAVLLPSGGAAAAKVLVEVKKSIFENNRAIATAPGAAGGGGMMVLMPMLQTETKDTCIQTYKKFNRLYAYSLSTHPIGVCLSPPNELDVKIYLQESRFSFNNATGAEAAIDAKWEVLANAKVMTEWPVIQTALSGGGGGILLLKTTGGDLASANAQAPGRVGRGGSAPSMAQWVNGVRVTMVFTRIIGNVAGATESSGGGISIHNMDARLEQVFIDNNVAGDSGGGILLYSGTASLNLASCTLRGNRARTAGGQLDVRSSGPVRIVGKTIVEPSASGGVGAAATAMRCTGVGYVVMRPGVRLECPAGMSLEVRGSATVAHSLVVPVPMRFGMGKDGAGGLRALSAFTASMGCVRCPGNLVLPQNAVGRFTVQTAGEEPSAGIAAKVMCFQWCLTYPFPWWMKCEWFACKHCGECAGAHSSICRCAAAPSPPPLRSQAHCAWRDACSPLAHVMTPPSRRVSDVRVALCSVVIRLRTPCHNFATVELWQSRRKGAPPPKSTTSALGLPHPAK